MSPFSFLPFGLARADLRFILRDLRILIDSTELLPPWAPVTSIIGPPATWFGNEFSEVRALLSADTGRSLRTILSIATPRLGPFRGRPGSIPRSEQGDFRDEAWFFINGVATNRDVLDLNGAYLQRLFGRSIELIHNPTDGLALDLLECAFGRTFQLETVPVLYAHARIRDALLFGQHERVVLLAHSQGGIVASDVAHLLVQELAGHEALTRLEMYTFASAADMVPADVALTEAEGRLVPYYEHYANTGDWVARLGVLHEWLDIPGKVYMTDASGHFLNAHYLPGFADHRYAHYEAEHHSRLYGYIEGGTPSYYNECSLELTPDVNAGLRDVSVPPDLVEG